jgi:hypothetical protein
MLQNYEWLKELATSENTLEERGVYDHFTPLDPQVLLSKETLDFLARLKAGFIEVITAFNELKSSPHGRIKLYGIAKTYSDFMLFRNGFKMVFAQKEPGTIAIRYNFLMSNPLSSLSENGNSVSIEEHLIKAKMSPFGDIEWTFQDYRVSLESIIRYHLTLFVRESSQ